MTKVLGSTRVQKSPNGQDEGVDAYSVESVAQVKHHTDPIGRPEVQQLRGAIRDGRHPIFYSLSGYTATARKFADEAKVALFTYNIYGDVRAENEFATYLEDAAPNEVERELRRRVDDRFYLIQSAMRDFNATRVGAGRLENAGPSFELADSVAVLRERAEAVATFQSALHAARNYLQSEQLEPVTVLSESFTAEEARPSRMYRIMMGDIQWREKYYEQLEIRNLGQYWLLGSLLLAPDSSAWYECDDPSCGVSTPKVARYVGRSPAYDWRETAEEMAQIQARSRAIAAKDALERAGLSGTSVYRYAVPLATGWTAEARDFTHLHRADWYSRPLMMYTFRSPQGSVAILAGGAKRYIGPFAVSAASGIHLLTLDRNGEIERVIPFEEYVRSYAEVARAQLDRP